MHFIEKETEAQRSKQRHSGSRAWGPDLSHALPPHAVTIVRRPQLVGGGQGGKGTFLDVLEVCQIPTFGDKIGAEDLEMGG